MKKYLTKARAVSVPQWVDAALLVKFTGILAVSLTVTYVAVYTYVGYAIEMATATQQSEIVGAIVEKLDGRLAAIESKVDKLSTSDLARAR